MEPTHYSENQPETDLETRQNKQYRHEAIAAGLMALPNLFIRSAMTLIFLYGLLTLLLIVMVQLEVLTPNAALIGGLVLAAVQYLVGPWIMDLMLSFLYRITWVKPDDLPEHLQQFVAGVCERHRMRFPSFGIIDDGAPQAFTYGHHPSNARVVISRGLMELLSADELEAVVAHELGHARNWDMALMTLANLVPLLLFYIYQIAQRFRSDRDKGVTAVIAIGAYVLYIISEYIVLWFSRTREYYADRFAGLETNNPNALSRALIKIAYGLAAQGSESLQSGEEDDSEKEKKKPQLAAVGAWGALNISDRNSAVTLVMSTAGSAAANRMSSMELERTKSAMQWDLWNPWASWFELNSTHPLTAKRLEALGDLASFLGQQPLLIFDRKKPESYWDDFFIDLGIMAMPVLGAVLGLVAFLAIGLLTESWQAQWMWLPIIGLGVGMLIRTLFAYSGQVFPHLSVAALLGHVKVSPVRPVPATVTGKIIGKGEPGLIYSEDFVLRDQTGILFMDYNQPLAIWNFLFGLLRAGNYQGKEVRVKGWFRRQPVPYLEVYEMEVVDGSQPSRTCYAYHAAVLFSVLVIVGGIFGLCVSWGSRLVV
jgi:Zn-dependent protease with chaperone function